MKILISVLLATTLLLAGCNQGTPSDPTQSPAATTATPAAANTETPAPSDLTPTPASPNEDVNAVDAEHDHDSHEGHDH